MLFSWRIAGNHFRQEAHQHALAARLRGSGAKCNPPPWSIKTWRSRTRGPTKSRATPCTTKSGRTLNSNSTCGTPYASNIRSGSSRTATVLLVVPTRGDSPNCLPYLLRGNTAEIALARRLRERSQFSHFQSLAGFFGRYFAPSGHALLPLNCECPELEHLNPHVCEASDHEFTGQEKAQSIRESVYRLVHPSVSQSEFLELFDDCRRRLFERGQGDFRDRDFIEDLAPDYCRCTDLHRRHRQQRDPDPGGDQGNQRRHFPSDLPYRWDYIGAIENS